MLSTKVLYRIRVRLQSEFCTWIRFVHHHVFHRASQTHKTGGHSQHKFKFGSLCLSRLGTSLQPRIRCLGMQDPHCVRVSLARARGGNGIWASVLSLSWRSTAGAGKPVLHGEPPAGQSGNCIPHRTAVIMGAEHPRQESGSGR